MTVNASMPIREDLERAYRALLKDEPLAGAVIDCASAQVLAANAGGLNALGLTPADRLPATLDSAMPAVSAIRDVQRQGSAKWARRTLVFWRNGRTSTRSCEVRATSDTSVAHVVVLFRPEEEPHPSPEIASVTVPEFGGPDHPAVPAHVANDDAPPRTIRDDSETLKEIARRIRAGQTTAAREVNAMDDGAPSPWDEARPDPTALSSPASPPKKVAPLATDDIAKLAHELKTPLTAIAAASEIMRDQRLGTMGNDKYLDYAADIHDSATHALAVIANMLNAATSLAPDNDDVNDAFDLTDLAVKTVSSLLPLSSRRGLSLTFDGEADLMPVKANATAVRQILLNLITNALKFTPPGGDIRVATGYLDDGAVYLVVRDTGDGIREAVLNQVFDETVETTSVRPGGGRGIGLRLVRRLAAENGANLDIDTAPGQGTVVLVTFPKDLVGRR